MKMRPRTQTMLCGFPAVGPARGLRGAEGHIYNEDPAHFAAFSGDLVPDNGAEQQIVEFCIVDDFHFFPYLLETLCAPVLRRGARRAAARGHALQVCA